MKKMFFSLAVFTVLTGTTLFAAGNDGDNPRAQATFKREFSSARNVSWTALANKSIFQASFTVNGERLNAFFNEDGDLLATGRYIETSTLPMLVNQRVSERYGQYNVAEAIELVNGGETSYILTLENGSRKVVAQAYANGSVYVIKKTKK